MSELTYDDIINRIGYFRTKANLSLRETSLKLGYNPQFMQTIENKSVELKVKTLIEFCDVVGISIFDFFYLEKYNISEEDKKLIDKILALSKDDKQTIVGLIKFKNS